MYMNDAVLLFCSFVTTYSLHLSSRSSFSPSSFLWLLFFVSFRFLYLHLSVCLSILIALRLLPIYYFFSVMFRAPFLAYAFSEFLFSYVPIFLLLRLLSLILSLFNPLPLNVSRCLLFYPLISFSSLSLLSLCL